MKSIRFLKRKEIDLLKWDQTIAQSANSLPYAFSWYLDAVAENWDALVLDDYEVVMPLVWMRKFGMKCLYQPYYCQQLGVFSGETISRDTLIDFIHTISKKFYYININLNSSLVVLQEDFKLKAKKNLLLKLDKSYPLLRKNYTGSHYRNIVKAEKSGLAFSQDLALKKFQEFYLENVDHSKENFKKKHERIFKALTIALIEQKIGKIFAVLNPENKILAVEMAIFHQERIVNIINSSSDLGKKINASHFLFDNIIRKYSGTGSILDFEGSSIPGVARFYKSFGAMEETFYNFKRISLNAI